MIARNNEELTHAIAFPKKWSKEAEGVFNQAYKAQCNSENKSFEAYAFTFPNELLLCISLVDPKQHSIAPVTYKASFDLENQSVKPDEIIDQLIDSASLFFDSYFQGSNSDDEEVYLPVWTETKLKNIVFHYQVSRENIGLTLEADKLLKL